MNPPSRIVTPERRADDIGDTALRPQLLSEFVGQAQARANLAVFIEARDYKLYGKNVGGRIANVAVSGNESNLVPFDLKGANYAPNFYSGSVIDKKFLPLNFLLFFQNISLLPGYEHLPLTNSGLSSSDRNTRACRLVRLQQNENLQEARNDNPSRQNGEPESVIRKPFGRVLGFLLALCWFGGDAAYFHWRWR